MALGEVGSFSQLDERASEDEAHTSRGNTSAMVHACPRPLYKRLPHGPHQLPRDEVTQNQRTRIHGAMIESVAQYGYDKTSVKKVVALAGVSRRSFYEQFTNKEECFLTSFDLIAARAVKQTNDAYRAADGELEDRLRAAFERFTEEVGESGSKGASLVMVQAPVLGAASLPHLCRATAAFEQMLLSSFTHAFKDGALPLPIIRGIVGGLHEVVSIRLRSDRAKEIPALAEEMLQWTLGFQASAPDNLAAHLAERALVSLRSTNGHATTGHSTNGHTTNGHSADGLSMNGHSSNGHAPNGSSSNGHATNGNGHLNGTPSSPDVRGRLLESVLKLIVLEGYGKLSPALVADGAGVSIDSFFELFEHKQECLTAAFDAMGDDLLQVTADPDLVSQAWPHAVRRAIGALMRHLASHPLHAQMIAMGLCTVGPEGVERNGELAYNIATLLTEGAPAGAGGMLAVEGVAGAIWHTVRCQALGEQIQRLPALTDYLTYVVLAPFTGAEAAAELITED